jgi:hypothetical protein
MAEKILDTRLLTELPPAGKWLPQTLAAWLIPGGGHFLLKRQGRAAILFAAVVTLFVLGTMQRGTLFEPKDGQNALENIINYGGFFANLCAGLPYLLSKALGYSAPDVAGHAHDYGTKFLVIAGLLNLLAMVDAFDIAVGKKD